MSLSRQALFLLVLVAACTREPAPAARRPGVPIGADAYRALLVREAGLDWGPEELARVARREAEFVRSRRAQLARRLGDADAEAALVRLRRDHAADVEGVLADYRAAVLRARAFVATAELVTLPPGRSLEVVATPAILPPGRYPFVAYLGDKLAVTVGAPADLAQHCRACIPSLVAHEAYPGHHVAFLVRRQPKTADPELVALANQHAANRFFAEGWAQYAEILMLEAGFYRDDPASELAAWQLVLLRLRRAELDADLHCGRIDGPTLVRTLVEELGVPEATAVADLAHHLEEPTQKASYLVGLLQILTLRAELAQRAPGFDRRAFHDRLLAWPLPWPEVARRAFGIAPLAVPSDGRVLARAFGDGL